MSEGKIVYFLGAGASNASEFELPTMDRFFRKDELAMEDYSDLRWFTDTTFPGDPADELNLEDVITYLELSTDQFGSFGKRRNTRLHSARHQFNEYVRRRLIYLPKKAKYSCSKWEHIFRTLKREDTIVTLNYDLVQENTLNAISQEKGSKKIHPLYEKMTGLLHPTIYCSGRIGIYFDERERYSGWYLKLHGSIGWCYCPNPDCLGHQIIDQFPTSRPDIRDFCSSCGSPIEMVIVPPTMHKAFGKYPKLGAIWSLAHEELTKSTSVVFVGVSFSPSDYYLSWLIKSSCLETKTKDRSIIVVDKCEAAADRVRKLIGKKPDYCDSLDKYISSLS